MRDFAKTLEDIKGRIAAACARAGRDPSGVEIVAVTKTHGAEAVEEAWRAGIGIVGENKVQEAAWKKPASPAGPSWHLIGHLQSNKVRHALAIFDFIHSVDSEKLAARIEAVAEETGARPRILLEVNTSGEKSKSGMRREDAPRVARFVAEHCPRISLEGFMTMAPYSPDREEARPYFRALRETRDSVEQALGFSLPRLSMGMSGDFETAVEEGATWVRLGTVLFGDRPKFKPGRAQSGGDGAEFFGGGLDSYSGEGPTVRVLD